MANKKTTQNQDFFMRINNPNSFRKNLLEASKTTLAILKKTYTVKQIRETKHELIQRITKEIKETRLLMQKLEETMPKYTRDDIKKRFPDALKEKLQEMDVQREITREEEIKPEPRIQATPLNEVDKLTQALDDVQRRLQGL